MEMLDVFKAVLLVTVLYSFSITAVEIALTNAGIPLTTVEVFQNAGNFTNVQAEASVIQESITQQTSLSVTDLGALVFYSGNILLDLILNFAFAIPQMIALFLTGLSMIMNIDGSLINQVQLISSVGIMIFYFVGLIQLITNIRSRGSVI